MPFRRILFLACCGLFSTAMLAGCDDGVEVNRDYPSTLGQAGYLTNLPPVVPIDLDGVPADIAANLPNFLQDIAAELSKDGPVRFALGRIDDGRQFAVRVSMQPAEGLTALSMCQGQNIGRLEARQRSVVVIAAVCDDRRRLGEVRAVMSGDKLQGDTAAGAAALIDAAIRKLFGLPVNT